MLKPFESRPLSTPSISGFSFTVTSSSAPEFTSAARSAFVNTAVVVPPPMPVDRPVARPSSNTVSDTVAALFSGTSLLMTTVAPASITTLSPSKSVAAAGPRRQCSRTRTWRRW